MPSRWKYPRYGTAWETCQWCGFDYPAAKVWLNPRYGWQCFKCWDGVLQRDQIQQPIFPGEGTRKVLGPVTNTLLQGAADSVAGLEPTYDYFLRDRITGSTYEVHLVPMSISATGTIVYYGSSTITVTLVSTDEDVWDGIRINNGWDVYVRNGVIATEQQPFNYTLQIVDGICDFGPAEGTPAEPLVIGCPEMMVEELHVDLVMTPPAGFDIINYHWEFGDGSSEDTAIPTASHDYGTGGTYYVVVTASTESESASSGNCPVTVSVTPSVIVFCPTAEIVFRDVDFTIPVPIGGTVTNYHWDFGDGTSSDTGATNTASHTYSEDSEYVVVVTVTFSDADTTSTGGCPIMVGIPPFCSCWSDPSGASGEGGSSGSTELNCDCALQTGADSGWILWGGHISNCFGNTPGNTTVNITLTLKVSANPDCSAPNLYVNSLNIITKNTSAPYTMNAVTAVPANSYVTISATVNTQVGNRGATDSLFAEFYTVMPVNPGNVPETEFPCTV